MTRIDQRFPAISAERAGSNQPVKTFRLGRIKAAVWENESDQKFYSVTFARTYVDETGKYHDTDSFGRDDLLLVAKLADQAHATRKGVKLHSQIKRRIRASQHFRSFRGAWRTIAGYEAIHMIRKGQACGSAPAAKGGLHHRFILGLFSAVAV